MTRLREWLARLWLAIDLRQVVAAAGVLVVLAGVGGFLVAASGIVPIKASSGHWPITAWFLNFSMARSVSLYSTGVPKPPPLDDPNLVLRGAGHFELGCRPCHGSPLHERPRIPAAMTPHPPYLPPRISEWGPEELFYIVKHGVKFTGMPAWPARERDDEVWAVVAFLRRLPDLDAEAYGRLTGDEMAVGDEGAALRNLALPKSALATIRSSCARCHGMEGLGRGTGAFPRLDGQKPAYLAASLAAYARGERHSGIMQPLAASLTAEEVDAIARHYAGQQARPLRSEPRSPEAVRRGETIAARGIPALGVPACADCHGPGERRRNPYYPVLAGQHAEYLVLQLELFKAERRGGTPYAHIMRTVTERLRPEQMRDVALYYESLARGAT